MSGKKAEQIKKWGVSGPEQDLSNYRSEMKCGALLVVSAKGTEAKLVVSGAHYFRGEADAEGL
ncbi:MAG: hypothetical protein IPJ71_02475 [Bdellovibrionales bacterium]|nr:hypothetical protein [Bdellovibrionales bacterium]